MTATDKTEATPGSDVGSDIDGPGIQIVQHRTLRLLFTTQAIGGVAVATGFSVGALLVAEQVGVAASGLVQSAAVIGSAVLALPATTLVQRRGRRPSLFAAYLSAAIGGVLVVLGAMTRQTPLLFSGFFLFGGATTASLQSRYAAIDLAPPGKRGRHLSIVVWATTIGSVVGPNLAGPAGELLSPYGVPTLAAPFVISVVLLLLCAGLLLAFLRPDPIVLARAAGAASDPPGTVRRTTGLAAALPVLVGNSGSRLAVASMSVGHVVMVSVMAMTPIHIRGGGHDPAHTLRIVGIVLSLHIAGMFAFSPLVGWLTDRIGRKPMILAGAGFLVLACLLAGQAGADNDELAIGLTLLGLGWSCTMVAGSTLLTESISPEARAAGQGLADLTIGLCAAAAGAVSGIVVQNWGYPILTLAAATMTIPLVALVLTTRRAVSQATPAG